MVFGAIEWLGNYVKEIFITLWACLFVYYTYTNRAKFLDIPEKAYTLGGYIAIIFLLCFSG